MMSASLREYETILIAEPELNEEALTELRNQFGELVTRHGGRVENSHFLGKRRLSYRIGRFSEGNFLQIKLQMPPNGLEGLKRMVNQIEPVMRILVVSSSSLPANHQPQLSSDEEEE